MTFFFQNILFKKAFLLPVFFIFYISSSPAQSPPLFEHFSTADGLPSGKIYDVTQTADGNIWFASAKGVCRFDGIKFHCMAENFGLGEMDITGILTDPNGKIWCWSSAGTIYYFENNRFYRMKNSLSPQLSNNIINSIAVEKGGAIWISTVIAGELLKMDGDKTEMIKPGERSDFSFFIKQVEGKSFVSGAFKSLKENNQLAVFTENENFTIALSEKGNFSKTSLFTMAENEFLFSKGQEIVHFNSKKIIQRSFTGKNVQDIIRDSEGKIWAGLYLGGVICYPEGRLSSSGMINYLGNKSVSSILEDNSGNIWFTTMEDGVYYLPARSKLVYSSPKIFSQKNGNINAEKPKALTVQIEDKSGIAAEPGLRVISTDTSFIDTLPPTIFISGMKIMENDTVVQTEYELPFDKNFLKIYFVGFAFTNPEALKYKYRMEGVDKNWIYSDNTFVQYTTLPPGSYTFSVSAMNKNGIWSETPATVSFIINPPYWRTWWFISLCIAAVSGLFILFFFIRIAQIKRREKEKAEISRQMANAELQALRAQMNPHFIFNTLSSIQYFITKNETEGALKYLSKFAKLMRKIMDNSKKSHVLLKDEIEALNLYLDLESLRFKDKFIYSIKLDENIDPSEEEIPPMLIQPYIENAILHGLMNKSQHNEIGKVKLEIKKQDQMIICCIEDNGVGREKAMEINNAKRRTHSSSGMSITKNRLEILNNMNQSKLSVNIVDLKSGEKALGTRVEVFIPL